MSVKIAIKDLFQAENSVRLLLEKSEVKEFSDKIPFELTYWATKLSNKIQSELKSPREQFQKLNESYGINEKNANKPLKDILKEEQIKEFAEKRDVILNDEVTIDIFPKNASLFDGTGIGGYTLMGLIPFLEDDLDNKKGK
jgi:hypothetical protein